MAIPSFVARLRKSVGHDLLWMPGVTAVVRNDRGEVLLVRRADFGHWSLVSGILEPGEQPAHGLVREIHEETGVTAEIEALAAVWTLPEVTYPNGDRAQYVDLCFLARYVSGQARVNDDESTDVGWFPLDALPSDLVERSRVRLERALAYAGTAWFEGEPADQRDPAPSPSPSLPYAAGAVQLRRARREDVAAIVRSIRYAVDVGGVEHVALGSDFDGAVPEPFDATGLVLLTEALLDAGFADDDIARIMGGNVRRLLADVLPDC